MTVQRFALPLHAIYTMIKMKISRKIGLGLAGLVLAGASLVSGCAGTGAFEKYQDNLIKNSIYNY